MPHARVVGVKVQLMARVKGSTGMDAWMGQMIGRGAASVVAKRRRHRLDVAGRGEVMGNP